MTLLWFLCLLMKGLHPDKQTNQTRQCNVTPQSWENNASRFEKFRFDRWENKNFGFTCLRFWSNTKCWSSRMREKIRALSTPSIIRLIMSACEKKRIRDGSLFFYFSTLNRNHCSPPTTYITNFFFGEIKHQEIILIFVNCRRVIAIFRSIANRFWNMSQDKCQAVIAAFFIYRSCDVAIILFLESSCMIPSTPSYQLPKPPTLKVLPVLPVKIGTFLHIKLYIPNQWVWTLTFDCWIYKCFFFFSVYGLFVPVGTFVICAAKLTLIVKRGINISHFAVGV